MDKGSSDSSKTTNRTTNRTTTASTQRVLAEIIQNPSITIDAIADKFGLTYYGVYYHIRKLKKNKIIVRVGGLSEDGYWKVLSMK